MWQYVFDRALLMFAQATTGMPAAPGTPVAPPAAPMAPSEPIPIQVPQTGSYHHTIWHTILLIIYFVICLGLVVAVLLQTTKNEGLSGMMGGGAQSVFKGKKGFEERLQEITNYLAVSFLVISFMVSMFAFKLK